MRRKVSFIPQWFKKRKSAVSSAIIVILIYAIPRFASDKIMIDETMPKTIPPAIVADWKATDSASFLSQIKGENFYSWMIENIYSDLPETYKGKITHGADEAAYLNACHWRRVARIQKFPDQLQNLLYARHHDIGGSIIGFTEEMKNDTFTSGLGMGGAQPSISRGPKYTPGGALLVLNMENVYPSPKVLLEDKTGCIRDPCVSFDGAKVVFAWSKDNNGYHIYETEISDPGDVVQLTDDPSGLTVSDFEPCYLPNGDIVFNSSRCFGYVDCNFNITSNLYIMNKTGKYLRRIGFDQLHTCYPTMMSDGKVLFSRWEYNDRNIATCFGLFSMNVDGSHQTELFGNQTTWPATIPQAREIPGGSKKILATVGGHYGPYCGDLVIIDPRIARNGSEAVTLIAPKRPNPVDFPFMYGVPSTEKLFQNPYPLDEEWFLISYRTDTSSNFRIYLMNVDGERELLAWDAQSVSQQQSLCPQPPPFPITAYQVDYSQKTGRVTLANAYYGAGTGENVEKGSIKKIRVIELEYHTDPSFGTTGAYGILMTPVARWLGSWLSKRILGEAKVEEDGSADFIVPARAPIYFQLIDDEGCAINSMRSWATLMPGEVFSCYGCHEDKNASPPPVAACAILARQQELDSFYGIKNDFLYYPKHIQPIWDAKCVKCHKPGKSGAKLDLSGEKIWTGDLKNDPDNVNAGRFWCKSYYNLTAPASRYVSFIDVNSPAEGLEPYSVGSKKSILIGKLRNPPSGMSVSLTKAEMGKICAWIDLCIPHSGFYTDDMRPEDSLHYLDRLKRREQAKLVEERNIDEFKAVGGYKSYSGAGVYRNRQTDGGRRVIEHAFNIRLSSSGKSLIVRVPGNGRIALIDMLGRTLMAYSFNTDAMDYGSNIPIRAKLPKGIYIATFKGAGLNKHTIINVQ